MAISAVILGAAAVGSAAISSRATRKAASQPAPPAPQPNADADFSTPAAKKQDQTGRRRGGRGGTVLTSGAGVTNGQSYQGSTLLGS